MEVRPKISKDWLPVPGGRGDAMMLVEIPDPTFQTRPAAESKQHEEKREATGPVETRMRLLSCCAVHLYLEIYVEYVRARWLEPEARRNRGRLSSEDEIIPYLP